MVVGVAKRNIVLLATAWGARHGGINSFNRDFAVGLAAALGKHGVVYCAVPAGRPEDEADAAKHGVHLIQLPVTGRVDRFDPNWVYRIVAWLKEIGADPHIEWWVGHDVASGDAALEGPKAAGRGRAALIHHMSYVSYQGVKHDDATDALAKHRAQRSLFGVPGASLFAVGPFLRDSCRELAGNGRKVTMLVPGFAGEPTIRTSSSTKRFLAVCFGRMETASDRIKQGRLALAGFGAAVRRFGEMGRPPLLRNPTFYLIGLPNAGGDEEGQARSLIDREAGRTVNVFPLPYDEDRDALYDVLASADLSLMLSWHEGFGLTGWEAIAAGVPVVIGRNSGLFQLVDETLGGAGTGCLHALDLEGKRGAGEEPNYTEADKTRVRDAILEIAGDRVRARRDAQSLRRLLTDALVCTWQHTGKQFLDGLSTLPPPLHVPPDIGYASSAPPTRFRRGPDHNPVPGCAELLAGTTQGSTATAFDLLPELRFGRQEFDIEGLTISYGLAEAALRIFPTDCGIVPGTRQGDDKVVDPNIEARGDATWRIIGPRGDGEDADLLLRSALGTKVLCGIHADLGAKPSVEMLVTCAQRQVRYRIVDGVNDETASPTKNRILQIFLNKCLGAEQGIVTLCRSSIAVEDDE